MKLHYNPSTTVHYNPSTTGVPSTLIFRSQIVQSPFSHRHLRSFSIPRPPAAAAITSTPLLTTTTTTCDVVVIGAGIGGLCCAALLVRYGLSVIVCESHTIPGGAAHAWQRNGFHFESGPSLYSGMGARSDKGANPLALCLQAIDEPLELLKYNEWNVIVPELPQGFPAGVGPQGFDELLLAASPGPSVIPQFRALQAAVAPLAQAATALPPAAIRLDPGVLISGIGRYFPSLLTSLPTLGKLTAPFSEVLDAAGVTDAFLRNYFDLLCFLLSGLPARGTITAEVAFMMKEWLSPDASLEFPKGGSQALVDALVRGVTKTGRGEVRLGTHIEAITVDNDQGRATGVKCRNGDVILAARAVVCNASTPDMLRLLPDDDEAIVPKSYRDAIAATPLNPSFMHLHLGFDTTGLEATLGMHHIVVNTWKKESQHDDSAVTAPGNVVLISIPSVADPSLAPPGKGTLHAYYPATEPWAPWEGLDRKSPEYFKFKEERAQALWEAVERVIPDIRQRVEVEMVGTPLTHARFLRRHKGSYGPAWRAGEAVFPFGTSPVKDLYSCGDFVFPGIGLPAVAASGAVVANTLVPLKQHLELLDALGI